MPSNYQKLIEIKFDSVPFEKTVKGKELINEVNGKKAVMYPIHKEPDFAVTLVEVDKGFIHKSHNHDTNEIVILIEGKMMTYFGNNILEVEPIIPIKYEIGVAHENHFLEDSRVLAITIPADRSFPNDN